MKDRHDFDLAKKVKKSLAQKIYHQNAKNQWKQRNFLMKLVFFGPIFVILAQMNLLLNNASHIQAKWTQFDIILPFFSLISQNLNNLWIYCQLTILTNFFSLIVKYNCYETLFCIKFIIILNFNITFMTIFSFFFASWCHGFWVNFSNLQGNILR